MFFQLSSIICTAHGISLSWYICFEERHLLVFHNYISLVPRLPSPPVENGGGEGGGGDRFSVRVQRSGNNTIVHNLLILSCRWRL